MALSYEYKIDIFKINDLFIEGNEDKLIFRIEASKKNWRFVTDYSKHNIGYKLFLKLFLRFLHLSFFILPNRKSYKIGSKKNIPKFLIANNLKSNFSIENLIQESKDTKIILSGWGLRDWDLVLKHKKIIVKNITNACEAYLRLNRVSKNDYLLVHIRKSDFLSIDKYKDLNFSDETWLNSILKLCAETSINEIVLFSDSILSNFLISKLIKHEITVIQPDKEKRNDLFLEIFINYVANAKFVMCNASSLALSFSFIFHKSVFLPSRNNYFQKVSLYNAHKSYPALLNWN